MRLSSLALASILLVVPITGFAQGGAMKSPKNERLRPDLFTGNKVYCYFDEKAKTWRLGNDVVERTIHFDRETGSLKTTKVFQKVGGQRVAPVVDSEGEWSVAGTDPAAKPVTISLSGGWAYIWQSVSTPEHGGRLLTIHLHGIGPNQGYEAEALYEIFPGNRPYLTKTLTLINRTETPKTVQDLTYDRWQVLEPEANRGKAKSKNLLSEPIQQPARLEKIADNSLAVLTETNGLLSTVLDATAQNQYANGTLVQRVRLGQTVPGDGARVYAPRAVLAAFDGSVESGTTLYQRFLRAYSVSAPPLLRDPQGKVIK